MFVTELALLTIFHVAGYLEYYRSCGVIMVTNKCIAGCIFPGTKWQNKEEDHENYVEVHLLSRFKQISAEFMSNFHYLRKIEEQN